MDGGETSTFGRRGSEGKQEDGADKRDPSVSMGGIHGGGCVESEDKSTGLTTATQETDKGPSIVW